MSPRRKSAKRPTPKALASHDWDAALPVVFVPQPARTTHRVRTCLGGMPVPRELYAYLIPGTAPRSSCVHCGSVSRALNPDNPRHPTCPCLCHAAYRFDAARLARSARS
jgi:hypothetical protein